MVLTRNKQIFLLVGAIIALIVDGVLIVAANLNDIECAEYPCLVFEDNFDTLDFETWEHEISAENNNLEFQYHCNNRTNSFVKDGVLHLKPTLTENTIGQLILSPKSSQFDLWGSDPASLCTGNVLSRGCHKKSTALINPIQSAKLRMARPLSLQYGRLEIEAKLPKGDWLRPGFWLDPTYAVYGDNGASGQIGITEARGNENLQENGTLLGIQRVNSMIYFSQQWDFAKGRYYVERPINKARNDGTFADSFHKFRLDWDANGIRFFVDNVLLRCKSCSTDSSNWRSKLLTNYTTGSDSDPWRFGNINAPFDQEFHLTFNLAVGGKSSYFKDEYRNNGSFVKPWRNNMIHTMVHDFSKAKSSWYPTWSPDNDGAHLQINYVKIWKLQEKGNTQPNSEVPVIEEAERRDLKKKQIDFRKIRESKQRHGDSSNEKLLFLVFFKVIPILASIVAVLIEFCVNPNWNGCQCSSDLKSIEDISDAGIAWYRRLQPADRKRCDDSARVTIVLVNGHGSSDSASGSYDNTTDSDEEQHFVIHDNEAYCWLTFDHREQISTIWSK